MDTLPISADSLKDLYGESFYLLEGELEGEVTASDVPAADASDTAVPNQENKTSEKAPATAQPVAETPAADAKPGITWRVKPTSKVLFIISAEEWSNKVLLELLKKIVASLGLPFELAGFGLINGPVQASEFEQMPQKYGVVFDADVLPFTNNPSSFAQNEVFFSHKLNLLQDDKQMKMELWGYLKQLKEIIN